MKDLKSFGLFGPGMTAPGTTQVQDVTTAQNIILDWYFAIVLSKHEKGGFPFIQHHKRMPLQSQDHKTSPGQWGQVGW